MQNPKYPAHSFLKMFGSKHVVASWVTGNFPAHQCFVDLYGGGAAELFAKQPADVEVYNDINSRLVNVFRVMQNPRKHRRLRYKLALTPFARSEYKRAWMLLDSPDEIEAAWAFIVRCNMQHAGNATEQQGVGFCMSGPQRNHAIHWHNWKSSLDFFHRRLADVIIENYPAVSLIKKYDSPNTLFYADPPYVMSTRKDKGAQYGEHEMNDVQHAELVQALKNIKGMAIVSGYESEIYMHELAGWQNLSTSFNRGGKNIKIYTETIWMNAAAWHAMPRQEQLFDNEINAKI